MQYQDIRDILTEFFNAKLSQIELRFQEHGSLPENEKEIYQSSQELANAALLNSDYSLIGNDDEIQGFINALALPIVPESHHYETVRTEYLKAYREYCKEVLQRDTDLEHFQLSGSDKTTKQERAGNKRHDRKLSECIDEYAQEKRRFNNWDQVTEKSKLAELALMQEFLGSDASLHVSVDMANEIMRMLSRIPKRARSNPAYKKLSLQELMTLPDKDQMQPETVNKYLRTYAAFYDWAVNKKRYTDENNFSYLPVKLKTNKSEARDAFTREQVKRILDEATENKRGLITKPHQKWGTIIAMYTGARLNEIAQLELDDINQADGIWCFEFTTAEDETDMKKLKNANSKRKVPIHSHLMDLGFLAYVEDCRKTQCPRLFPDLSYSPKNGYGRNLGRWFNESFLVKMGIKTPKLSFHSFRHTVTTELYRADVTPSIASSITGHQLQGVQQQVYLKGFNMEQLQGAIEKLDYAVK